MPSNKKIVVNCLKQDCFVRDIVPLTEQNFRQKENFDASYYSLDEVGTSSGIRLSKTLHPYEITPESLNSYYEGSNYLNNVSGNLNLPPRGVNLGDVASLQRLAQMSEEEIQSAIADYQKFLALKKQVFTSDTVLEQNNTNLDGVKNG